MLSPSEQEMSILINAEKQSMNKFYFRMAEGNVSQAEKDRYMARFAELSERIRLLQVHHAPEKSCE